MSTYDDSSIKALKGAERVRKRPGVMFGSDDIRGALHTVTEILSNSLDEARAGFGKLITVTYHSDNSISILDEGRGVPLGWNEAENNFNWHLIFNELYAGGKYSEEEEGGYEFSNGLNGLGAAATQYVSDWMNVVSYRSDGVYRKSFIAGSPTEEDLVVEKNEDGKTGTFIHWMISNEVFPNTSFTKEMFVSLLESQAHLNSVTLKFIDEHDGTVLDFVGEGIEQYLKSLIGDKLIDVLTVNKETKGVERGKKYKAKAEIVLAITEEIKSKRLAFHNTGVMRTGAGVHETAFNDAVTDFFKKVSREKGVTILPYDYADYISVLISTYSNITSFANQTKDGVSNDFVYQIIYNTIKDTLEESALTQRSSITTLINNVVGAAYARKKAKEIEAQERLANKIVSQSRQLPENFRTCRETNPHKRELFIVEGKSALTSCEDARDGRFQAILPLKGKPMNGLKTTVEKLLNNEEVRSLVNVIGTGIDIEDGVQMFNINKLQYDKLIITTDADVDGNQIRVLCYTIFYRLMPDLLKYGKVFVAETPLFEITAKKSGDSEIFFAYTQAEYDSLTVSLKSDGYTIKNIFRSKGLGQNNPDMLRKSTMAPETRRLVPLTLDVYNESVRAISNMLFGLDPEKERKEFIFSLLVDKMGADSGIEDLISTISAMDDSSEDEQEYEEVE